MRVNGAATRDLRAGFRRFHGRGVAEVQVIVSDCDDTGARDEAWFGPIRLPGR